MRIDNRGKDKETKARGTGVERMFDVVRCRCRARLAEICDLCLAWRLGIIGDGTLIVWYTADEEMRAMNDKAGMSMACPRIAAFAERRFDRSMGTYANKIDVFPRILLRSEWVG